MGSKNNPGEFDCYAAADPDEPMFVLLGRDPVAAEVVAYWAALREQLAHDRGDDPELAKAREAVACAEQMRAWASSLGKNDRLAQAETAARRVIRRGGLRRETFTDWVGGR